MIDTTALLQFHRNLVRIPSVSHHEEAAADFVQGWLEKNGACVRRYGNNVIASGKENPKLLLNSHLDTVPPCAGWTRDPYDVESVGGKVLGLGSNDAKGPASAMAFAFEAALREGRQDLALMLVADEETGGNGSEIAWPYVRNELEWDPKAVLVGEPTELQVGSSQSGLLLVELVARGIASHSANADPSGATNPIFQLATDLVELGRILAEQKIPATIQPTVMSGSSAHNQVSAEARVVLDIRSRPEADHGAIIDELRERFDCEVEVKSRRLLPFFCPESSHLVRSIMRACPDSRPFHSNTMSDLVFFQNVEAVKIGPGVSARSHSADEFILESELIAGTVAYSNIIREFLS